MRQSELFVYRFDTFSMNRKCPVKFVTRHTRRWPLWHVRHVLSQHSNTPQDTFRHLFHFCQHSGHDSSPSIDVVARWRTISSTLIPASLILSKVLRPVSLCRGKCCSQDEILILMLILNLKRLRFALGFGLENFQFEPGNWLRVVFQMRF